MQLDMGHSHQDSPTLVYCLVPHSNAHVQSSRCVTCPYNCLENLRKLQLTMATAE